MNTLIQGRTIICLASSWDYDPTSKHQIMKLLAEHNQIIWVNYHGTRRPSLNRKDARAAWSALKRFARGIRPVGRNFVQMTPLVLPGVTDPVLRRVHQRLLLAQLRRALRQVPGAADRPLQIWSFAPDVPFLVDAFDEECFVYYCVDDYAEFEGLDAGFIARSEDELVRRSDLVITTSELLFDAKRRFRDDTVMIRHGVDFDHFAAAWRRPLEVPEDIARIKQPIFGFFGLIHFWIDRELIARVARLRPDYAFVLIGDRATDTSAIDRLPNVHLLGRRPNSELPAYCAGFRAGLLPFTRTAMTRSVNPIKMYEYLAAGLPIISTPLPEAERFTGPVSMVNTAEEFAAACDDALASDYPGRREAISRSVANESWRSKVELISALVEKRLAGSRSFNGLAPALRHASRPAREVLSGAVLPGTPATEPAETA